MKKMLKNATRVLIFVLLASMLFGCNTQKNNNETTTPEITTPEVTTLDPNMMECTIGVSDYFGNAMAGITALIKKGADVVKTITLGNDGLRSFTIEKGNYTVIFEKEEKPLKTQYWNYDFRYDEDACTLSPEAPSLLVTLLQKPNGKEDIVFVDTEGEESALASRITSGAYQVTLTKGTNYFVFRPSEAGLYEISYLSDETADIAYHNAPTWCYKTPVESAEPGQPLTMMVERQFVQDSEMSTTPFVFSFTASARASFTLLFKKVAEAPKTPQSEPWETYLNPDTITDFSLPEGAILTDFDVFDKSLSVVFNEADGYYHLNSVDGPVILIRLTSPSPYLESFFKICNTTSLGAWFYDEEGNFERKEIYNELIYQYTGTPDINGALVPGTGHHDSKSGTYPLDRHLAYAMLNAGEHKGWWTPTSPYYRFFELDPDGEMLNAETAWLFACCYVAE